MPIIIVAVPLLQVAAYVVFMIFWMLYMVYQAASGEVEVLQKSFSSNPNSSVKVNVKTVV